MTLGTRRLTVLLLWSALALSACSGSEQLPGDAAPEPPADAGFDASLDASTDPVIVDQVQLLDACLQYPHRCTDGDDPACGQCQYRLRYDASRCSPEHPCDDLLLVWAFMLCDGPNMEALLDRARDGHPDLVTACVQPLYPGEMLPLSLGAPERENEVVGELFAALRSGDTGAWTGENLLHAGCSHGASRYPVVAARYPDDAGWMGSRKTAACFSEGGISIPVQDRFIGQMLGVGGPSCPFRHARMIEAYTSSDASAYHGCDLGAGSQCACDPAHAFLPYPGDCDEGDCVTFDSIVEPDGAGFVFSAGVTADAFSVRTWRLISEGADYQDTA